MPVSYDKLWKLLIDRKMNRTDLKEKACISYNIIAKMGKNAKEMAILDASERITDCICKIV